MPRALSHSLTTRLTWGGIFGWIWMFGSVSLGIAAPPRPNIVLIITDDQGYGDLSCHGNPILQTPRLDRLAAESLRWTNFHVSPTCAPTRSALLTGRHEFKNGVTHTIYERERLTLSAITLPQVLAQAGYATGIFGKWHLGDEDPYQPTQRGFQEAVIHGGGGIGQSYPGSCGDAPGNSYFGPVLRHNGRFEKTEGYCTDEFFTHATRWIDTVRGKQPFFCYLATNAPHAPLDCPDDYIAKYTGKVKDDVAKFYGMIGNIDDNVGRLLDQLEAWNLSRDTLVIFLTDNGSAHGAQVFSAGMRAAKGTPYEGGTRVPLFLRWPGTIEPGERSQLVCHYDLFPTLVDWLELRATDELRRQIEGRSLRTLITDATAAWPSRDVVTHVGRWDRGTDPRETPAIGQYVRCSLRRDNWTLVSMAKAGPPQWELYDLTTDPGQMKNVAAEHPAMVRELHTAYDAWWTEVLPHLVNERVPGPDVNPFHAAYWTQYQGPGPNNVPPGQSKPRS